MLIFSMLIFNQHPNDQGRLMFMVYNENIGVKDKVRFIGFKDRS